MKLLKSILSFRADPIGIIAYDPRMKPMTTALLLALALLAVGSAEARHHRSSQQSSVPGQFDYYLLTLSWSPAYCVVHPDDASQCRGRGFGFVLHGLWPQFDAGGYPQYCGDPSLPPEAVALGARIYPSPKLVRHEWERHGTCSGLGPVGYFKAADRATAALRIPALFEAPRADQSLTAQQIQDAFHGANPALPSDSLTLACSRGELSEVRVCLTRDLRVRPCGRGVRNSCPREPVRIRSVRQGH